MKGGNLQSIHISLELAGWIILVHMAYSFLSLQDTLQ